MHAEVTIRCLRDLPKDLTRAISTRLGPPTPVNLVLKATVFGARSQFRKQVVYSHIARSRLVLIFSFERQKLTVHIEHTQNKDDVVALKHSIEEVRSDLHNFLLRNWNLALSTKVEILSATTTLLRGEGNSPARVLVRYLRTQIVERLLLGAGLYFASLLLGADQDEALRNLLAVLLVSVVVLLINIAFMDRKIQYQE